MTDIYSQLKPAWHPEQLRDLKLGRRPTPVHVQLILSDLCNQDCGFCAYRMSSGLSTELFAAGELAAVGTNNPKRQIPTAKALEIIDDCGSLGVKAIQFTGGGEPTAHPDHLSLFAAAQERGIETALVTNGVRLNPLAPANLRHEWVRVSVDAGDATTYAEVRRVPEGHWNKVWANIETFAAEYTGVLGIGFVITPENWHGVWNAARLAKAAGARNIRVGAVFSSEGSRYYGNLIPSIRDEILHAKTQVDGDGFEVIDLFSRRIGDLDAGHPSEEFCGYQYFTVYVGGDLNVYRCCNTAYTLAGKVGSLKEQRFRDAWPLLGYEPFDARLCRHCQFIGQNKAIAALMTRPEHVNFV